MTSREETELSSGHGGVGATDAEPSAGVALDPERLEDLAPAAGPLEKPSFVLLVGLLAWAVPGAGHATVGRLGRAALFGALILALFVGGLALDGKVYRPVEGEPLTYLAALGASGIGIPFVVAHGFGWADGNPRGAWFEYGSTFTLVAGLLNLLVLLDAYDYAIGRRR